MRKLIFLLFFLFPIYCFGAAATMYVTVAGAGGKTGADWANAMSSAEFETDIEGAAEAGDIYYVMSGTYDYSGGAVATARDGAAANPVTVIIDGCTTGISADAALTSHVLDYNNFDDNTADVSNVTKGANATAYDPEFGNAGAGDFSVGSSDLAGVGFSPNFDSLSISYPEVGAVQSAVSSGGGGSVGGLMNF